MITQNKKILTRIKFIYSMLLSGDDSLDAWMMDEDDEDNWIIEPGYNSSDDEQD